MSYAHLLQQFDALGPLAARASITLDSSFTGSARLMDMFREVLGTDALTLDVVTAQTLRSETQLQLTGTASLLGLTDAQVTFRARDEGGELAAVLEIALPQGFTFSTVFPALPEHTTLEVSGSSGEKVIEPHFLDRLSLGTGRLVFSSHASTDAARGHALVPGLNFSGELYFMGLLFPVRYLLRQDGPVLLAGPLDEYKPDAALTEFLGVRLSAPLDLGFERLGPLTVQETRLFLKAGLYSGHEDPVVSVTRAPGVYILMAAELGGRPLQLVGGYDVSGESSTVDVHGRFTDFALSGFSSLAQTAGVPGLEEAAPPDFPSDAGLALTELGASFDFVSHDVASLVLGVGARVAWDVLPGVAALKELGLTFTVVDPFGGRRRVLTSLSGLLAFRKFSLAAYAEHPSYRFGAGLPAGQTLPLGDVIESFLPEETDLPALTISQLLFEASPRDKTYRLSATLQDLLSIPVGATAFEVRGFSVLIEKGHAVLSAWLGLADTTVILGGEVRQGLVLSGSLQGFALKKFWSLVTAGEALPDEVPDVVFETLAFRVDTKTRAFSVQGNAVIDWEQLSDGGSVRTRAEFTLSRDVSSATASTFRAGLSLQGEGPVPVAEGLSLGAFNLLFSYQTGAGWQLSGGVSADVAGTVLSLQAGYESSQGARKMKLRATAAPEKTLLDLDGVGAWSFSQFDLLLDRRGAEGGKKTTYFDLRLASTLEVDSLFKLGGYVSLSSTAEGKKGLVFKPNPGSTAFHLDFPTGEGFGFRGELSEVGIVQESASAGWSFTGTTVLGFTGLSSNVAQALPAKVTAKLVVGSKEARLSALNPSGPISVALPRANGKELGKAVVQLTELGISIKPRLGMVLEAGLGLPAELNTYLGTELFRVYQADNPLSLSRTRFTISGTGVAMQFLSSPFAGANAVVIDDEAWFDVDFGRYGAIRIKLPTFTYDGVSQYFEAGGGVQVTKPLALPLAPLKLFLEACGAKGMSDVFPDAIPIEALDLVDANNELEVDALVAYLEKAGSVPDAVVSALKQAGSLLNRFPVGFRQYLQLDVPEHLEFKLGFSPAGRVSMGLLAPKTPVRVLFPSVVQSYVPMPGLTGLEVRKFSVGTLLSGSLLYGEVDALIDQFDLPSLAVSLMLPRNASFPLPTSDQLQRRIILDDVFCVIPVAQGLPVPLPVFYDEVGFEYLGVEGLGLQAHVSFPKPKLDGAAATAVFQAFNTFFNERKALLDPKTPPGGVDLAFRFHDEYLQAPEYLGSGVLGTRGKTLEVGTWKYLAALLNFGKTFSINDCIGAIPVENRAGSAEYRFAFMKFDADWLLTTPAEFRGGAFQRLKLTEGDREDFLAVLPAVAGAAGSGQGGDEEGLVAFVRGEADLGFLRLEAAFGLAASGAMGFNTGFKFEGAVGAVEIELSGAIMVNAPLAPDTAATPAAQPTAAAPAALPAPAARYALAFNGKDQYVEIPASDSLLLPEYTIELWIRSAPDQGAEWADFFGIDTRQGGYKRNFFAAINAKSRFYHHRFTDAGGGNSGAPNTAAGTVAWDRWQHLALTNDGVTAKTFIDGAEAASGPVKRGLVLHEDTLWLGRVTPQGPAWKGQVAEVRIWKRARTPAEVAAGMHERLAADEKDLVSLYRFDADTGDRLVDLCGRNHGRIRGARFEACDLMTLRGLDFNGRHDFIEVPDSESLRIRSYTVEVWFKPRRPAFDWSALFGKKGRNYTVLVHHDGFVHHRFHTSANWNDGIPNTAADAVKWGQWNHVAITNDGRRACTLVNGRLMSEAALRSPPIVDNERVSLGRNPDGTWDQLFNGELAEVRLWSVARNPGQLLGDMRRRLSGTEEGLVSLWRPGEAPPGDTLPDVCKRNPGRIQMQRPAPPVEPAKLRHDGLLFNGTSDSAFIPSSERFKTAAYTIEAWVRPDKAPAGSWQCIWGGSGKTPKLYLSSNGIVSHRYTTESRARVLNTPASTVRFGEWNHLAITHDGLLSTVYVNGVACAQEKVSTKLVTEAASVNVGRSGDKSAQAWFRGSIDDLRYWSVARTPAQLQEGMNVPLKGTEAGLVAHYGMDHTAGTRLVDSGPYQLHGEVKGGQWALAAPPSEQKRASIQLQGHTQLTVAGHVALRGDLKLVDDQFWFSGLLDLFPSDWPLQVKGQVEGMVSKKRFYVQGETRNALYGVTLSQSRVFLSNDELRLEGRWLGAYLLLDVSWEQRNPRFAGSIGLRASTEVDFGTVRMNGVKVGTNVHASVDLAMDVSVSITRAGFAGDVTARFKLNGKGFELRFSVDVAPSDLDELVNWVKQRIIDTPLQYLGGMFADAVAWLSNVASGAIDFIEDAGEAIGQVLSSAYKASREEVAKWMKGANFAAGKVGNALRAGYGVAADEAAKLLRGAGYVADQVGGALRSAYGKGAEEVAKLLKGAEFVADEVMGALRSVYGTAAEEAAKWLRGAGYVADQVGGALKSVYGASAEEAAKWMRGAGYAADQVGGALKSVYGASGEEATKWLRSAGYATDEVCGALRSAYGASAEQTAKWMRSAGYSAKEVGDALKNVWNLSSDEMAKALKAAEYSIDEVGGYVKDAYGLGADALNSVLRGAGYASSEVSSLFKKWGGEFGKAASKLDPTKW